MHIYNQMIKYFARGFFQCKINKNFKAIHLKKVNKSNYFYFSQENQLKTNTSSQNHTQKIIAKTFNENSLKTQKRDAQSITKKQSNISQSQNNQGFRIQFAIFNNIHLPKFLSQYIYKLSPIQNVISFNQFLTHGGQKFQQFPLVKLLNIALRYVHEGNQNKQTWRKLQFYIRGRMHRSSIEQNLKLLFVMLKIFHKYKFNYDFILSTCLALKKQIKIMNYEQLQSLFFVMNTNNNQKFRYQNPILLKMQTLLLFRLIQKSQTKLHQSKQKQSKIHLPIEHFYRWIAIAMTSSLRNNYIQLAFQQKVIRLIHQFNRRWEEIVRKQQKVKLPSKADLQLAIQVLYIFNPLIKYFSKNQQEDSTKYKILTKNGSIHQKTVSLNFIQQFENFKANVLIHSSKNLSKIIDDRSSSQFLKIIRTLVCLDQYNLLFNLISQIDESTIEQSQSKDQNVDKIQKLLEMVMKIQENQQVILQKLTVLSHLLNKNQIDAETVKRHYLNIDLSTVLIKNQQIVYRLIQIQLFLYLTESKFNLSQKSVDFILQFLQDFDSSYRGLDWLSFHFINLLLKTISTENAAFKLADKGLIDPNIKEDQYYNLNEIKRLTKILKKITNQISFYKTNKLVQQDILLLKKKREITQASKFFIQIQINEMKPYQVILEPFNRIVHFGNKEKKIAVNVYNQKQLKYLQVLLQKKLMNLLGWRIVNLNSNIFRQMSLNQRINLIASQVSQQQNLIQNIQSKLFLLPDGQI